MGKYKYITYQDREKISVWYRAGDRPVDIAERLGVSAAAVYRELKRGEMSDDTGKMVLDQNQRRAYNPALAQKRVQENLKRRGRTAIIKQQGGLDSDRV